MRKHKRITGLDADGCDDIVACDANDREWVNSWKREYPGGDLTPVGPFEPPTPTPPTCAIGRVAALAREWGVVPALSHISLGIVAIVIATAAMGG